MTSEIMESDVGRVFHLYCSCGTTLVTSETTATCTNCAQTLEVRRARKRGQSPIVVEYKFQCCFCGAAIVSTEKSATCASCGKTLKVIRAEKRAPRWNTSPQYDRKQVLQQWCLGMAAGFLLLCYLLDLASC
jgi:rRNA maturation endonuclease Nob1